MEPERGLTNFERGLSYTNPFYAFMAEVLLEVSQTLPKGACTIGSSTVAHPLLKLANPEWDSGRGFGWTGFGREYGRRFGRRPFDGIRRVPLVTVTWLKFTVFRLLACQTLFQSSTSVCVDKWLKCSDIPIFARLLCSTGFRTQPPCCQPRFGRNFSEWIPNPNCQAYGKTA